MKKYIFPSTTLLVVLYTWIIWIVEFDKHDDHLDAVEAYFKHFGLSPKYSIHFALFFLFLLISSSIYIGLKIPNGIWKILLLIGHFAFIVFSLWGLM